MVRLPDRRNALSDPFLSRRAARQLVVDGEIAHAVDPHRARSGQEVDHVDIVRALLQQQAVAVRLSGVPVAEIGVAAVADEVAAPDRLDFSDRSGVDDLLHLADERHVTHVVADDELGSAGVSCLEDAVGAVDRDCDRFFEIDRNPVFERIDGMLFVQKVRTGDDDAVELLFVDHFAVVGVDGRLRAVFFAVAVEEHLPLFRVAVRAGDDARFAGQIGVIGECAAPRAADKSDSEFFHKYRFLRA